ncbi:hypothetical protein L915_06070 [Phytophthora nicotianae]|uniref:Uncharacterized protein n=1 Tax=Phytophthora nicotianae TaxID=4792 RepID=W2H4A6_PHYNI|nr:hypothetical protein L915_06070 [Phytophthora nicotianae]ETL43485.1 hypothetical protein L916_06007 [Phytophthora nicotianae]
MIDSYYYCLREFLSADDDDITDLLPPRSVHRTLEDLLLKLRCSDGLTLLDFSDLFDILLEERSFISLPSV